MIQNSNYVYKENMLTYDIYAELRSSVKWNSVSKEQILYAIDNSFLTVTVFNHNKAIAMGRVVGDGIYLTIVDVIVRPEYQKMKIGSNIISYIVKSIYNNMKVNDKVCLQLIAEKEKEQFYIKQGFELIPNANSGSALRKILFK